MLNPRRLMMSALLVSMLLVSTPLSGREYCYTESDQDSIMMRLEKALICEEQVKVQGEAIQSSEEQKATLQEKIGLEKQRFTEAEAKNALDRKVADERDIARIKELEEARKPRWSSIFGSFGVGVVSGLLLVLLL